MRAEAVELGELEAELVGHDGVAEAAARAAVAEVGRGCVVRRAERTQALLGDRLENRLGLRAKRLRHVGALLGVRLDIALERAKELERFARGRLQVLRGGERLLGEGLVDGEGAGGDAVVRHRRAGCARFGLHLGGFLDEGQRDLGIRLARLAEEHGVLLVERGQAGGCLAHARGRGVERGLERRDRALQGARGLRGLGLHALRLGARAAEVEAAGGAGDRLEVVCEGVGRDRETAVDLVARLDGGRARQRKRAGGAVDARRERAGRGLLGRRAAAHALRAIGEGAQRGEALIGRVGREQVGATAEGLAVVGREGAHFPVELRLALHARVGAAEGAVDEQHGREATGDDRGERARKTDRGVRHVDS